MRKQNTASVFFDVHDAEKKDEYLQYRRSIIQNYDERYKNLDKKFFNKSFFERFAKKNQVMIEFGKQISEDIGTMNLCMMYTCIKSEVQWEEKRSYW